MATVDIGICRGLVRKVTDLKLLFVTPVLLVRTTETNRDVNWIILFKYIAMRSYSYLSSHLGELSVISAFVNELVPRLIPLAVATGTLLEAIDEMLLSSRRMLTSRLPLAIGPHVHQVHRWSIDRRSTP